MPVGIGIPVIDGQRCPVEVNVLDQAAGVMVPGEQLATKLVD